MAVHVCNYVFFSLILATLFSFYIYWHPKSRIGSQDQDGERKEERIRPKKRDLHELLFTIMVKSHTIVSQDFRIRAQVFFESFNPI